MLTAVNGCYPMLMDVNLVDVIQSGCQSTWMSFKVDVIQSGCHSKWMSIKVDVIQSGCH